VKTKKQILEEIAALKAEFKAICQQAKEDKRELSADEQTRCDVITGVGHDGDDDHKPGQLATLTVELKRAERRDEIMRDNIDTRVASGDIEVPNVESDNPFSRIRVPASAHRPAKMRAFVGEGAVKEAYASGMFVAAIFGNERAQSFCLENGISFRATMKEGIDSLGGVTVPDPLSAAIIRIVEETGIFRQFAGRKAMSSPTDTTPRRVGGLKVYYPDEGTALTKSDLVLDKVVLNATKYAVLSEITTELNEDSVLDMVNLLTLEMGYAKAKAEDLNGLMGDGTGAYASVTGVGAAIAAVAGTPGKFTASTAILGSLILGDFEQLEAALPEFTGVDPAWYCNKSVWGAAMAPLMRAAGGNTMGDLAGRVGKEFMGYPVRVTQVMPKTPTAGQPICYFGDLMMSSTLGTRREMSFATSTEGTFFTNDTIGVKSTQRIAIKNHEVGQAAIAASGDQAAVPVLAGPILSLVAPVV